jgi:cytochrome c556
MNAKREGFVMKVGRLAVVGLIFASAGALAQVEPVAERSRLMSTMWREGLSALNRMGRGQEPYNRDLAERSLARVGEIARQLPPLWPAGSAGENAASRYASSPKVWENKADFDRRLAGLPTVIAENRGKALTGPEGARAAFETVNNYCDSCHEVYRVRVR